MKTRLETRQNELFKEISLEDAKREGMVLPWALIRQLSLVQMGETSRLSIDWDEVTEARFFDNDKEIRIFEAEDGLSAVLLSDGENEAEGVTYRDTVRELEHKEWFGAAVSVREYFGYDEDGQLCAVASRLNGWR